MPEELLDDGNALGFIRSEHERIKALFASVLESDDIEIQRRSLKLLTEELAIHSRMERELFYPFARAEMFQDSDVIDRNVSESLELDSWTDRAQSLDPAAADFHSSFGELVRKFQHHIFEMEQYVLLTLEGGDFERHNKLVLIARRMHAMRDESVANLQRPREIAPGVQGTNEDLQLRKAQQQGRNLDPDRDIVAGGSDNQSDLSVTTEGDVVNMGDKRINLERGEEGPTGR